MRFASTASPASPEELQRQLASLACERQRLRETGTSRESLERNRLEIAHRQHELSHALIRRHLSVSSQPA
ncbi:MAG: hypothetical protein ACYDHO_06710 [Gaiellaceae bacterium]